ncbi:MAG: hypothetical protein WCI18_13580 [Pseudomonadota bacterium]
MFYPSMILLVSGLFFSSCNHTKPGESASDPKGLESSYGANKLYLWNRPADSSQDNIAKSCWYYKEASSKSERLDEKQAMIHSVRINSYAIADAQIEEQLQKLLIEKLASAGGDFVPCGISAVSLYVALQTAGTSAIALGVNGSWAAHNCIKNTPKIIQALMEMRGASEGKVSLRNGEGKVGKKSAASKAELDIFRQAIKRAMSLGLESESPCSRPVEFIEEIER